MQLVQYARLVAFIGMATALLGGCASITGDSTQFVRVDTVTADGTDVPGASCELSNDFATVEGKSGGSIQVHRSSKDLDIHCVSEGKQDATGRAISRANAGMAGNILFGGGIGAIIDYNKGTGLTYPTWIRLVFGQTRVFDRKEQKGGAMVVGTSSDPLAVTPAVTSQLAAHAAAGSSGFASIDDVSAIPYANDRIRDGYRVWLTRATPRAFAVSGDGHFGSAWGNSKSSDPAHRAIDSCQKVAAMTCKLYAVDDAVVWIAEPGAATAGAGKP